MNCEFHTDADRLIAVLSGEIDHHHVAPVRESIDEKIEAQNRYFVYGQFGNRTDYGQIQKDARV